MRQTKMVGLCVLNGVAALFIGLLLYVFLRSGTHIHSLLGSIWVLPTFDVEDSMPIFFLKYYLVDFLWGYALAFFIAIFWRVESASVTSFLAGCFWECLQKNNVVSGTFDYVDIIMYLIAALTVILIIKREKRKKK